MQSSQPAIRLPPSNHVRRAFLSEFHRNLFTIALAWHEQETCLSGLLRKATRCSLKRMTGRWLWAANRIGVRTPAAPPSEHKDTSSIPSPRDLP